jgi:hypothetical protein
LSQKVLWAGVLLIVGLLVVSACSDEQRAIIQTAAALPPNAATQPAPTETPQFSLLVSPTPLPTAGGMMGTWTAVAQVMVIPTLDTEPVVIINEGRPHFVEFHALW